MVPKPLDWQQMKITFQLYNFSIEIRGSAALKGRSLRRTSQCIQRINTEQAFKRV